MKKVKKISPNVMGFESKSNRESSISKWPSYGPLERKQLAHIKRLLECYRGDPHFRRRLHEIPDAGKDLLFSRGIELDPEEVSALWEKDPPSYLLREELRAHRLFKLFIDHEEWEKEKISSLARAINASISTTRFRAWHRRQIARCKTEFGQASTALVHGLIVFELTKGCSRGCWFCGVNAQKLKGVFAYTAENRALWREILTICKEQIGPGCSSGICYWATEPLDNPDYLSFVMDYKRILGWTPATTTAAAVKDLDRTRELLVHYSRESPAGCRFSITKLEDLHTIHEHFSAEKLGLVELVLQNKGSIVPKVSCGKFRESEGKNPANESIPENESIQGSIACVTGFLVNMVDRSIKLISPCVATDRWPMGYRVFWESSFCDGNDFLAAIRQAIDEAMPAGFPPDQKVAFRNDLAYEVLEDGFRLANHCWRGSFRSNGAFKSIGPIIDRGESTIPEIVSMAARQGIDLLSAVAQLNLLFEQGFLEDDFATEQ